MQPKPKSLRLLVLTDDENDYLTISSLEPEIDEFNFKIDWVSNVPEGLERFGNNSYDVVVLGEKIGGKGGLEFYRLALAEEIDRPLIYLTSARDSAAPKEIKNLGFNKVLEKKHCDRATLAEAIQNTLDLGKLYAAMRERAEFTSTIIHDMRGPLTAISLSLQVMEEEGLEQLTPAQARVLKISQNNARRLRELIDNILDIGRLEQGNSLLEKEILYLDALMKEVIIERKPSISKKNLMVTTDFPPFIPPLKADKRLIRRVLANILDNAIKFTPEEGEITVSLELVAGDDQAEMIQVSICDSGSGLPENVESHLFEKLVTGRQLGRGTGLGLAFCKLAVEAHRGRIWVDNERGQGATFSFTLPVKM